MEDETRELRQRVTQGCPVPKDEEPEATTKSDIRVKISFISSAASVEHALAVAEIIAKLSEHAEVILIVDAAGGWLGGQALSDAEIAEKLKPRLQVAEAARPFVSRQEGAKLRDQYRGRSRHHKSKL